MIIRLSDCRYGYEERIGLSELQIGDLIFLGADTGGGILFGEIEVVYPIGGGAYQVEFPGGRIIDLHARRKFVVVRDGTMKPFP
jgi:hypothetical protein